MVAELRNDLGLDFELPPESGGVESGREPGEPGEIPRAADRRRRRAGFYVKTTASGTPNWEAMDEPTRAKVKAAFPGLDTGPVVMFSAAECLQFYGILGELESGIAAAASKCPRELARQFFRYSQAEAQALAEPTSRVLSKHAGLWLSKYKDELVLVVTLLALHQRKVIDFAAALKEHRDKMAAATKPGAAKPDGREAATIQIETPQSFDI